MKVVDLVETTVDARLSLTTFIAVVVDILQETDKLGFVKDPNDWAYTVSMSHRPALHRRVFECEVEKLS